MLSVLRNRDYRLLATGQLTSSLGDWLLLVAAPFHVLTLTGSTLATTLTVATEYLPALLLGPIAGTLADRWNRRHTMLTCDLTRAATITSLLLVQHPGQTWLLYTALATESALSRLFGPARAGVIPAIVGRGPDLASAKSLSALINGTVRLLGGPLGGTLYAIAGFGTVVLTDAATYLASATAILALRYRDTPAERHTPPREAGQATNTRISTRISTGITTDLRAGLTHIRHTPGLPALLTTASVFLLGNAMLTALLVPYVNHTLHSDAHLMGLLFSALGIGFLAGAPLSRRITHHPPHLVLSGGLLALAAVFAAAFNIHQPLATLALFTLIGPPAVSVLVTIDLHLTLATPDHLMGRVVAVYGTAEAAATLLGMAGSGVVAQNLGIGVAANAAWVTVAGAGLLALPVLRALRALDEPDLEPQPRATLTA